MKVKKWIVFALAFDVDGRVNAKKIFICLIFFLLVLVLMFLINFMSLKCRLFSVTLCRGWVIRISIFSSYKVKFRNDLRHACISKIMNFT